MELDICQILFYVFAALALVCSIAVVAARNPVNSAMNMALCFAFTAAILFGMGAQFLGIVQLIVYAGAILVLFLFIIMMLDVKAEERSVHNAPAAVVGVAVAAIVAGVVTAAAMNLPGAAEGGCPVAALCEHVGDLGVGEKDAACAAPAADAKLPAAPGLYGGALPALDAVAASKAAGVANAEAATASPDATLLGKTLFDRYNIAFVILGFALLAGTVGAVALARKLRQE